MFDDKSRYKDADTYTVPGPKGREVSVVAVPDAPDEMVRGVHQVIQGQRLDHLAAKYLDNPAGYWRITELANAMRPEELEQEDEIEIPRKRI